MEACSSSMFISPPSFAVAPCRIQRRFKEGFDCNVKHFFKSVVVLVLLDITATFDTIILVSIEPLHWYHVRSHMAPFWFPSYSHFICSPPVPLLSRSICLQLEQCFYSALHYSCQTMIGPQFVAFKRTNV